MITSAEITLGGTVRESETKSKDDQQQPQQQQQHSLARQGTVGSESTQVSYLLVRRLTYIFNPTLLSVYQLNWVTWNRQNETYLVTRLQKRREMGGLLDQGI